MYTISFVGVGVNTIWKWSQIRYSFTKHEVVSLSREYIVTSQYLYTRGLLYFLICLCKTSSFFSNFLTMCRFLRDLSLSCEALTGSGAADVSWLTVSVLTGSARVAVAIAPATPASTDDLGASWQTPSISYSTALLK